MQGAGGHRALSFRVPEHGGSAAGLSGRKPAVRVGAGGSLSLPRAYVRLTGFTAAGKFVFPLL